MKNNNQKVIRRISNRSIKKNKMRNILILIAISLTALLFTTLFSLGSGMLQATQEQAMRRVGTRAHGGLKNVTMEQYETITSQPLVKDSSYNILIGMAKNEELIKRQTEIRYTEAKDLTFGFTELKEGRLPQKEDEIVVDSIVMDMLGITHELGEKVTLQFEFMGEDKKETFTISGWYQGDPVSMASELYLSRAYLEHISENYTEEDFLKADNTNGVGLIQGSIMFRNANHIEENMNRVIVDSGYLIDDIEIGINWAYLTEMSQDRDFLSTLIIIIMFLVLMLTGYLIIYNIFQISIIGDIRFYGLLKTIGATKKQIKRLVLRQAFLLSCIGIPIGLVLGFLFGDLAMPFFFNIASGGGDMNGFHLEPNPYIFLFGALFSFITVFISCRKPGKIASSVSPVEAAKYSEVNLIKRKKKKSKGGARIYAMALSNLKRNKKKTIITILSLSLSIILMTEIVTFSKSFNLDQYMENMLTGDFMICSSSLLNFGAQIPDLKLPEDLFNETNAQDGIESVSRMFSTKRTVNHILSESGNRQYKEFYEDGLLNIYEGENSNRPLLENIIKNNSPILEQRYAYDGPLLGKLRVLEGKLDIEKFNSGKYILVAPCMDMNSSYYHPGDMVELQYRSTDSELEAVYDEKGENIDYTWANYTKKEYEVMAVVEIPYSMTERSFIPNSLTTILPVEEMLKYDNDVECFAASYWVVDEKEAAFQSFLANYTTRVNPNTDFESKEELREQLSSMTETINIVGGALSFVIGIIGILNFINTMLTSVITRKRELAMLQSIGLTNSQLRRMLIYEGLYYIGFTAVISFVIGSFLSVSFIRALNNIVESFVYHFTVLPFLILLPVFLLVGMIVPYIAYFKAKKQSIIERLREGE